MNQYTVNIRWLKQYNESIYSEHELSDDPIKQYNESIYSEHPMIKTI